jgi:DNA-binding NtrC family response regulator/HAMP domain-containing protein
MRPINIRKKLLLIIAAIVISSGLAISQIVTHRYSDSLFQGAAAQAENIAHSLALDAADKILINDLVALQKLLDDQMRSTPSLGYLFIIRDGRVLTHTFHSGLPAQLLSANTAVDDQQGHLKKIVTPKGERYLDIAWPVFNGKAGVLRLGFSEKSIRQQVKEVWIQISLITVGVLLLAIAFTHLFIKRVTGPLLHLTEAAEKIGEDNLALDVAIEGKDEVGKLGLAFRKMLARIREYTQRLEDSAKRLEEKNLELNRAHRQTRTSFEIAKEVGALLNLKDISIFLINRLKTIITCQQLVLLCFSNKENTVFVYTEGTVRTVEGAEIIAATALLETLSKLEFIDKTRIPLMLDEFKLAERIAVFPLHHEGKFIGTMCIGCPGQCDCVTNELDVVELILNQSAGAIHRAAGHEDEIRKLQTRIDQTAGYGGLVGKDPRMQVIYKLIDDVATSDATILIQGESGTGKELVARAIHQNSHRQDKPFVVINCSAYPTTLLESELFGHEKGAFTGALQQKAGRFEQADGGTVFLDEIGEIPPSAQIKLLRVLQSKKFERIGGQKTLTVDVRILAATNKDLLQEVKNGQFREDLFYRLNVIPIDLPSLRMRRNDIPLLARHFLQQFATSQDKNIKDFSSEAMRRLIDYPWPGNVRELENSVEHAAVLAREELVQISDLPTSVMNAPATGMEESQRTIKQNEKQLLVEVLEECGWNKKKTAQHLGISRSSLYNKIKKHRIAKPSIH